MLQVQYMKVRDTAKEPVYATDGSAGLDLSADLNAAVTIGPGESCKFDTGIAFGIPTGYVGLLFGRSGLAAKHQIGLTNGVAVIDSDFTGSVGILLTNHGHSSYTIQPGERVAQIFFVPYPKVQLEQCDSLKQTIRGSGGFGSTGNVTLLDDVRNRRFPPKEEKEKFAKTLVDTGAFTITEAKMLAGLEDDSKD